MKKVAKGKEDVVQMHVGSLRDVSGYGKGLEYVLNPDGNILESGQIVILFHNIPPKSVPK